MNNLILVTGASGYIASRLIPCLLEAGRSVRALARHPHRLDRRNWSSRVEIVSGDVMDPPTLTAALQGVHTAYYLIHSMSSGHGYDRRELVAAHNFVQAAQEAGTQHIIYLGGLADPTQPISSHMRSRIETGIVLGQGRVPVTEFRASVIAGSGSISFEMIRFITESFPIIPGPTWFCNKAQPIAVQNVIDYLCAALNHPGAHRRVFEIGGPEVTYYRDLMLKYAKVRGLRRWMMLLPRLPLGLMAFGVGLMTPVPRPIARALIGGLSADSVVRHPDARTVFPEVQPVDFETAARDALERLHPAHIERVWEDGQSRFRSLKHEGFFILHREMHLEAPPERAFSALARIAKKTGRLIEEARPSQHLLLHTPRGRIGEEWLEWRLQAEQTGTRLVQTLFFAPRGMGGFIYWHFLHPFIRLFFHGLARVVTSVTGKPARKVH